MRIKELFTVPEGKKVTEKALGKVLVSSVCSMLLCMACLAGTTWAWFTVSIENEENVIQTADVPRYILQVDDQDFICGETLLSGKHTVRIVHDSDSDDLQKKCRLYVTFTLDDIPYGYIILGGDHSDVVEITVDTEKDLKFLWTVSWFKPGNSDIALMADNAIQITEEDANAEMTEPTEESAEATETPEESTTESTEATSPTNELVSNTDFSLDPLEPEIKSAVNTAGSTEPESRSAENAT